MFRMYFELIVCNLFVWLFFSQDRSKAVEILVKDLKVFSTFNEELFKEITQLLTLENFRYKILKCTLKIVLNFPLNYLNAWTDS